MNMYEQVITSSRIGWSPLTSIPLGFCLLVERYENIPTVNVCRIDMDWPYCQFFSQLRGTWSAHHPCSSWYDHDMITTVSMCQCYEQKVYSHRVYSLMYLKLQAAAFSWKAFADSKCSPSTRAKNITNTAREFMAEAGAVSQLQERWHKHMLPIKTQEKYCCWACPIWIPRWFKLVWYICSC